MKLNDFSGGLSLRLDPSLIQLNEAVVYTNVDNAKGTLQSIKNYTGLLTSVGSWFHKFKGSWYSSYLPRDYVEYRNKLYYTEDNNKPRKVVPVQQEDNSITYVEKLLGIEQPQQALTISAVEPGSIIGEAAATVQYAYTYYDSVEGVESAPSPLSEELNLNAGYSVDITNFAPSENSAVDKIRLYRIGAYSTDFTLLIELPIATTAYNDNIKTVDAVGSLLDSYFNNAPVSGLQYLVEAYGILFACKGDTLYYTEVGKPDAWSSVNVIHLPADITGLAPIAEGLIIHTIDKTSVLLGTAPETFRLVTISKEHGCLNHRSIQYVSNTLVWEAADGICAYSSGSISVITRDKLDRQVFNSRTSTVYNGQYFLALLDGSVFVMDTRLNTTYKTIKFEGKYILNVKAFDNKLYAVIDGELSELFTGDVLDLHYVSPEFTEGDAAVTKLYNNIYVRANGRFSFSVLIDGVVVLVTELLGNKVFDIKVPQEKQRGSSIQFDIFGHGVIKEIEWKVQGRENGR